MFRFWISFQTLFLDLVWIGTDRNTLVVVCLLVPIELYLKIQLQKGKKKRRKNEIRSVWIMVTNLVPKVCPTIQFHLYSLYWGLIWFSLCLQNLNVKHLVPWICCSVLGVSYLTKQNLTTELTLASFSNYYVTEGLHMQKFWMLTCYD